jgi:hypothetical protein
MVIAILSGAVAVRLFVITHFNINWDEFHYLSEVYDYLRADLVGRLQTFHVHFFGWLAGVSPNEADQVIAARAVMLSLHLLSAWLLYRIARRLTNPPAGRFAAAAYLSVSFVIWNGASFRTDPILTSLVMAALDLALCRRDSVWRAVGAGFLFAVAMVVTIKAAIFLPTVLLILAGPLLTRERVGVTGWRLAAASLAGATGFGLLYGAHALAVDAASAKSAVGVALGSLSKTVGESGLFPRLAVLVITLRWDMAYWALLLTGATVVARRFWKGSPNERGGLMDAAALALPIASIIVYRNSFSYFYASVLAPGSVLTAFAWQELTALGTAPQRRVFAVALKLGALTWFVASLIFHGIYVPIIMPLDQQRTVLTAVHRAFPSPTPYLDSSSMVASFPNVGFFMTTWGMDVYFQRGEPYLQRAIERTQPHFLLANHALLDPEYAVYPASLNYRPQLLGTDRAALAAAFIHHWGPIYVAGKRFGVSTSPAPVRVDMLIGGRYTLEADGPLLVDSRLVQPGHAIDLGRGPHWVKAVDWEGQATLRWGEHLYRPAEPPPQTRLYFLGF